MCAAFCSLLILKQMLRSKERSAPHGYEEAAECPPFDRHSLDVVCSGAK